MSTKIEMGDGQVAERLRADLAAERELCKEVDRQLDVMTEKADVLRADLAAANERATAYQQGEADAWRVRDRWRDRAEDWKARCIEASLDDDRPTPWTAELSDLGAAEAALDEMRDKYLAANERAARLFAELREVAGAVGIRDDECSHPWRDRDNHCDWFGWEYGERTPTGRNVIGGCFGAAVGACCACLCGDESEDQ